MLMSAQQIKSVKVTNLNFDPENPRFAAANWGGLDSNEIIETMLDREQVIDLINSIGTQGYFGGEPLLVFPEDGTDNFFVAEGNRRLAALKLLSGEVSIPNKSLSLLIEELSNKPSDVPCIIFPDRESVLHYLGYRHITGIKAWGSLEKAIYLDQLFKKNLQDSNDESIALKKLSREIGSNVQTIKKTLCALAIYHKDYNALKDEFFGLQHVGKEDIQFSLLYTAIGYPDIAKYLGLENAQNFHLNSLNVEHARDLFNWLFMQDEHGRKAVSESRKISVLNNVLSSPEATEFFKRTRDLDSAYKFTNGPQDFFNNSLTSMEKTIEEVTAIIRNEIFVPTDVDLHNLDKLSDSLDDLMRKARRAVKKSQDL